MVLTSKLNRPWNFESKFQNALLDLSNGYLDNQRSIPFVSSDLIDPTDRE